MLPDGLRLNNIVLAINFRHATEHMEFISQKDNNPH